MPDMTHNIRTPETGLEATVYAILEHLDQHGASTGNELIRAAGTSDKSERWRTGWATVTRDRLVKAVGYRANRKRVLGPALFVLTDRGRACLAYRR